MYKHILIATDGSELGAKAVDQGLDLAKQLGAKVTAITVTEPWTAAAYGTIPTPTLIKVYDKAAADNAARILASVSDVAKKKQVACDAPHVKDHYPRTASSTPPRPGVATSSSWLLTAVAAWPGCCSAARRRRSSPSARSQFSFAADAAARSIDRDQ
jgi:nucleotide-binding universal stress UspA family protein